MAWGKKSYRYKSRPRRRGAPLARKRKTWEQFNIDPCNPVLLEHCFLTEACCTDVARIELLGNTALQAQFSDRCSVVRVLGDLWFTPTFGSINSPQDILDWIIYLNYVQEFLGLRRGEITSQQPQLPSLDIWAPTFDDLSEGQWFKTWQRLTDGQHQTEFGAFTSLASGWTTTAPVRTSDTHTYIVPGTPSCNIFASGGGDLCIETTTEDDCVDCGQSLDAGQISFSTGSGRLVAPWHVHIDVKKRIPLRENQGLYLVYNSRHFAGAPPVQADSYTAIRGNVRTLIEMG